MKKHVYQRTRTEYLQSPEHRERRLKRAHDKALGTYDPASEDEWRSRSRSASPASSPNASGVDRGMMSSDSGDEYSDVDDEERKERRK